MSFAIYPMSRFPHLLHRYAVILAVAGIVAVWMSAGGPAAAADNVFSVSDIEVDVTADTASSARAKAFRRGQRAAFNALLKRLTLRADHGRLPAVDAERLEFMVQALEVADERTSNVRYLANMTVNFKPPEIRRLLREAGIPFTETASKPLLVLPVLSQGGASMLWDENNLWRDAWSEVPLNSGLIPLILPVGDLSDISGVDAAQAIEGDPFLLSAMAGRYRAGDVLVAIATLSGNADAIRIDIAARKIGATIGGPISFNFQISDVNGIPELLRGAVTGISAALEEEWKSKNTIEFDRPGRMLLAVPLTSLEQWVSVERRLNNIASISEVALISLTRDAAAIEISHFGDETQLATTLAQQDLVLESPAPIIVNSAAYGSVQAIRAPRMRILRPLTQ